MTLPRIVLLVVAATGVFLLGRLSTVASPPTRDSFPTAGSRPAPPPVRTATPTRGPSLDLRPGLPPPVREDARDTSELDAKVLKLVDTGIAAGHWSAQDAEAMHRLVLSATTETREVAMRRLIAAVNAGRLRLDPGVPLL